jgi:hypothetical protein
MNALADPSVLHAQRLDDHINTATARMAPTWPLDKFIAVNPYWGWVDRPIEDASAALGTLAGSRLTMPRDWFAEQWRAGHLRLEHLQRAAARDLEGKPGAPADEAQALVDALLQALDGTCAPLQRLPLLTDLRDRGAPPRPGLSWSDMVTHQVSQHCAAFFDRHQAAWRLDASQGLYGSWRQHLEADHGLPWRQGRAALCARVAQLPLVPRALMAAALDGMGIAEDGRQAYLSAVLMAMGGWAAWCSHERWQARLGGTDDDTIEHLLAIRLAWEWLLFVDSVHGEVPTQWAADWREMDGAVHALRQAQRTDWLLQNAVEIAYQQPLIEGLDQAVHDVSPTPPLVQALFCIDVRSEVFRRALESVSPAVHTRGFAGFFGLPIAYSPLGSALKRPQLPGLLAPAQCVTEGASAGLGQVLAKRRRNALQWRQRWAEFRAAPSKVWACCTGPSCWPTAAPPRRHRRAGKTPVCPRRKPPLCDPACHRPPTTRQPLPPWPEAFWAPWVCSAASRRWCCWRGTAAAARTTRTLPDWIAAPAAARPAR